MATLDLNIDARGAKQGEREFARSAASIKRDARQTTQRVEKTSGAFDRLKRSVFSLKGALSGLGAAFAVRQVARFGQQALNTAENIADVSERTGVAAERLQGLREAFDQNGGSADQLDSALSRFNRRIGLAQEGTGAAAKTIERLNIELTNTQGGARATGDVLDDVIDVIQGIESSSERAAVASRFFGEEAGPKLAPLLARGREEVEEYTDRLRDAGLLMSGDLVRQAGSASAALRSVKNDLTRAFQIGLLEEFLGETNNIEDALNDLRPAARQFGETIGKGLSAAADAADDIQRFFQFLVDNSDTIIRVMGALGGARLGRLGGTPGMAIGGAGGVLTPEALE